jgi:hypothetical protein
VRTIVFAFLIVVELGLLILAVGNVQPSTLTMPPPALAAPASILPFAVPVPVPSSPLPDVDCPADNVRKQSCESRYISST